MLDRDACERRVFRLATLLLGDEKRAARVVESVIGSQPDLSRLDSSHLDRLTILRSREQRAEPLPTNRAPEEISRAIAALPPQQREAWVLHYVFRMMPRDMARAMDCSVRAISNHIQAAEGTVRKEIGRTQASAGKLLLEYSMSLDVPSIYRAKMDARRRWRIVRRFAIPLLIVLGVLALAYWAYESGWSEWFDLSQPAADDPTGSADAP